MLADFFFINGSNCLSKVDGMLNDVVMNDEAYDDDDDDDDDHADHADHADHGGGGGGNGWYRIHVTLNDEWHMTMVNGE